MRMFIDTKIIADWRDTGNAMTGNTGNVAHRAKAHDNGAGPAASIAIRSPEGKVAPRKAYIRRRWPE
jgi:hypothetical protein